MLIDIIIKQINRPFYLGFRISRGMRLIREEVWICLFRTDKKLYVTRSFQFTVYTLRKHMLRCSKFVLILHCFPVITTKQKREMDKFLTIPKDVNL